MTHPTRRFKSGVAFSRSTRILRFYSVPGVAWILAYLLAFGSVANDLAWASGANVATNSPTFSVTRIPTAYRDPFKSGLHGKFWRTPIFNLQSVPGLAVIEDGMDARGDSSLPSGQDFLDTLGAAATTTVLGAVYVNLYRVGPAGGDRQRRLHLPKPS
jgi:hypothetical protein